MKPQYNAPPGWHLWDDKTPESRRYFYFLIINEYNEPEFHYAKWRKGTRDLNKIDTYNPIIWQYCKDFARNLLVLTQLPAKTLQYMDGNPQTLANLALQVFEDGVELGYESFCPYENDPVHHDEPKCRKLMLKNYFDLQK